jgi:Flp pilus assembly protein TadG
MENPGNVRVDAPMMDGLSRSWMNRLKRIHRGTRGGALVEFALTLPILLLTITGIFSVSIAIYQKLLLAEAVSSGGRTISAERLSNDPCHDAGNSVAQAAPNFTASNINIYISINGGTAIHGTGASLPTCAGSGGGPNPNMTQGGKASVTATYPCTIQAFRFSFGSCTLTSEIVEEVQ